MTDEEREREEEQRRRQQQEQIFAAASRSAAGVTAKGGVADVVRKVAKVGRNDPVPAARARSTRSATGPSEGETGGRGMLISERNFLERLASHIPGIAGYREREGRRETDRRLRECLAGRLDEAAADLNAVRNRLTREGRLDAMNAVLDLDRTLQKTAAALRFADCGYSGLFDQLKLGEAELATIYAYDLSLLESVEVVWARACARSRREMRRRDWKRWCPRPDTLDLRVGRRRELFEAPGPAGPARGE